MAGEKKVHVEVDYENIILVDPNKVVNRDGTVEERMVEHENLMMYANLEARSIPRTKLAIGSDYNDSIRNVGVGQLKVNFLKGRRTQSELDAAQRETDRVNIGKTKEPTYMDTSWTDQFLFSQRQSADQVDTQLLGITRISVKMNPAFVPTVTIEMTDIQGRVLFEYGDMSPYSLFFQLPYPIFILTLKGYYGKATKFELMLKDFNARFDPSDGSYKITTNFIARSHALLSDTLLDYLYTVPKMYEKVYEGEIKSTNTPSSQNTQEVGVVRTTKGREKLKQVYSIYKEKGLIEQNFPEITFEEMKMRLEYFVRYLMENYTKENMSPLTDIVRYDTYLKNYRNDIVRNSEGTWYNEFIDSSNILVLENGELLYGLKAELNIEERLKAFNKLKSLVEKNNKLLLENKTFGENGKYEIEGGEGGTSDISVNIKSDMFIYVLRDVNKIDYESSYIKSNNRTPTDTELQEYTKNVKTNIKKNSIILDRNFQKVEDNAATNTFIKFGYKLENVDFVKNSFLGQLSIIEDKFKEKKEEIEKKLSEALANKVKSTELGIGFEPTINNVIAVICASTDAFYRLMDDVHKSAWEQRDNPTRLTAIIPPEKFATSQEGKNQLEEVTVTLQDEQGNNKSYLKRTTSVYPWPLYFEKEIEDDREIDVLKYPGQPEIASSIRAYDYDIWPEVEFVEEYVKGSVKKAQSQIMPMSSNETKDTPYISANAIEFPYQNRPYTNLDNANLFYEIWERTYLASNYTQVIRNNNFRKTLYYVFGDFEANNIIKAIESDVRLTKIFKEFQFSSQSFNQFLSDISTNGAGALWNNKIRDIYNKRYIQNDLDNSFELYNLESVYGEGTNVDNTETAINSLKEYIESTESDSTNLLDVFPFTNLNWVNNNLSLGQDINSVNDSNSTTKVMSYLQSKNSLATFKVDEDDNANKYLTYFEFQDNTYDSPNQKLIGTNTNQSTNIQTVNQVLNYYNGRIQKDFFLTESTLDYDNDYDFIENSLIGQQTTSLLNTPYFLNSIIKSVDNTTNGVNNPNVSLGYIYLNSLPLPTLSEKLISKITQDAGDSSKEYSDYIYATLNKFSALHKIPYLWVLKIGSIWHRYSEFHKGNPDILDNVWDDFDYVSAYDPVNGNINTQYTIKNYTGGTFNYNTDTLSTTVNNGINLEELTINNGLYPKVINTIYKFFTKTDVFTGYTTTEWDSAYANKKLRIGRSKNDIVGQGYDLSNTGRTLSYNAWYQYFDIDGNNQFSDNQDKILLVPSSGWLKFNQSKIECINGSGFLTQNIQSNQAIQNGNVRSLWSSPNYGYFKNEWIRRPSVNQYIKHIDITQNEQVAFNLINKSSTKEYKSIEELFSVFSYDMLQKFEEHFLNFCKMNDDYENIISNPASVNDNPYTSSVNTEYNFNIEEVMRSIFVIDKPSDLTGDDETQDVLQISNEQINNFRNINTEEILEKDVIVKIGNPGQFNRRIFDSFSTDNVFTPVDAYDFGTYIPNTLPPQTTLSNSISINPTAWEAMYLHVGDYTDPNMLYDDNGSYLTDFFIDFNIEFTTENVTNLSKIIKMYASYKLNNTNTTSAQFQTEFNQFLSQNSQFQNNILNHLFFQLRKELPAVKETPSTSMVTKLDGNISKNELWSTFKNLNDRWVSGQNFETRTIFEEFLFLDKANRPIGDKVIIDVQKFRNYLKNTSATANIYQLIGQILQDNNFIFMPTPTYSNFYGRQQRELDSSPDPNYSDIGENTFGTFLEVDTHGSEPKFLAIYVGKVSDTLKSSYENQNFLYPDDSFVLDKVPNPLSTSENGVTDFSKRNKVVGFNVDFGVRNQGVFKSIALDMAQRKNIAPTFQVLADMGNIAANQKASQQTANLYNFYKNGSYNCTVTSMGNVMIQPTMYFNLRYVPMFYGAYLITNVNHDITTRDFVTTFEGVRVPKYSLQMPDNLVQSINEDIIQSIKDEIRRNQNNSEGATETRQRKSYLQNSNTKNSKKKSSVKSKCETIDRKNVDYVDFKTNEYNTNTVKNVIQNLSSLDADIQKYIFGVAFVESYESPYFKVINNNLFNLKNDVVKNSWTISFDKQVCVKDGDYSSPYIAFDDLSECVSFFKDYVSQYKPIITTLTNLYNGDVAKAYTYLWYYTLRYTDSRTGTQNANFINDTINNEIQRNEPEDTSNGETNPIKKLINGAKQKFELALNKW